MKTTMDMLTISINKNIIGSLMHLLTAGHPYDYAPDPTIPLPSICNLHFDSLQLSTLPSALIEVRALPEMLFQNVRVSKLQTIPDPRKDPQNGNRQTSQLLEWSTIKSHLIDIPNRDSIELFYDDVAV